jgi:alpha-beta hydrolase superfamily lysophospholipase
MEQTPSSVELISASGGVTLHTERFLPAGAPGAAVVLVHGFSAHCGNYRHVAQALAAAGMATTLFDCRGHGRSQGRRGYIDRFSMFSDDLDLVMTGARAATPGLPLALLGHSHGATISLDYVLERRGSVDALVLAAPWLALKLKVPAYKLLLSGIMGSLWPTLPMGNELKSQDVSRNPDVWAGLDSDPLIHHVATPRWFNEVNAAQARIIAAAGKLKAPTLMLVAGDDRIVSTDVALEFAQAVGPLVEVKRYEGLFHELFLEPEREQVISDIVGWLRGVLIDGRPRPDRYT